MSHSPPNTQAVLFSIRTYLTPLTQLVHEQCIHDLIPAIDALPPTMAQYKRRPAWAKPSNTSYAQTLLKQLPTLCLVNQLRKLRDPTPRPPGSARPRLIWGKTRLLHRKKNGICYSRILLDRTFSWGQAPKPPGSASRRLGSKEASQSNAFCFFSGKEEYVLFGEFLGQAPKPPGSASPRIWVKTDFLES
jgi:hypothetical protein